MPINMEKSWPSQCTSVGSVQDLRIGVVGLILGSANYFPRIDGSPCDSIHCFLAFDHCFDDCYVGKHLLPRKEYCAEY